MREGKPLNLVADQWRTPTFAEDLAQGVHLALEHGATGIWNIAGPELMSIVEMGERIAAFLGIENPNINRINTATLNTPAPRPLRSGLVIDKAVKAWGFLPHTFEEGLTAMQLA